MIGVVFRELLEMIPVLAIAFCAGLFALGENVVIAFCLLGAYALGQVRGRWGR